MTAQSNNQNTAHELSLTISRVFAAPRALVFRAWTDPHILEGWWHPTAQKRPQCDLLDLQPGGRWRIRMFGGDGVEYTAWGIYREIVTPELLVYDDYCDANGRTFHKALLSARFDDTNGKTTLTINSVIDLTVGMGSDWTAERFKDGWTEGWTHNLEGLADYLVHHSHEVAK